MYLKRLELVGFKSFAHKTVLDFEPGMTAVVGPNGSGKSNVADALRWVMGEQSLKLLRGKKSEDVIFAGSDKKSKLSVAEVALTFDNKDRKIPLEYTEVEIRRRIYRNGESEYLMNGNRVRLLDVVDALMRSGFGATNYAVIGQGTIDQMILAGPGEIKNLVEEAAGVKPYYLKREKTIRRLQQTEENLSRVSELIAEIEPRLRSLKRQAKRMEEREAVANELMGLNLEYFGNQYFLLEQELAENIKQFTKSKAFVGNLESELSLFQKKKEAETITRRQQEISTQELRNKIELLESRRFKFQEEIAEIRGKLKGQLIPGQIDSSNLQIQKLDYERQIGLVNDKLGQVIARLTNEESGLQSIKRQLSELATQIAAARENRIDFNHLNAALIRFETEFISNLKELAFENMPEIKAKLQALVENLKMTRSNLQVADLSGLLEAKENLSNQLHALELQAVEQTTLKETYLEDLGNYTAKLNEINSLLSDDPKQFQSELFAREQNLTNELESLNEQHTQLKKHFDNIALGLKQRQEFWIDEDRNYQTQQNKLNSAKEIQTQVLIDKARLETRLEGLTKDANAALGGRVALLSTHKQFQVSDDLGNRIEKLKRSLELTGGIDESTLLEYRETEERFVYLGSQSQDLALAVVDLRQVIEELDLIIKKQFDEAFEKISTKFVEYFKILFNGGRAQMTLLQTNSETEEGVSEVDDSDLAATSIDGVRRKKINPEIVGIEIKATPPGKKLATIAALSGGERALTSIAMLCAMLASYPSPFVVLDEVDAALDEANSIRFAKILSTLAHQTQFITITHNRETMRQAHTLYGVTMSDAGISKILSLKLEQAEQVGTR